VSNGWQVTLIPPPVPLPDVAVNDGEIDRAAIETAVWAAKRLRLPIKVRGRGKAAEDVLKELTDQGVVATPVHGGASDRIELQWTTPEQASTATQPRKD
jgi:hypothetical protein